VPLEEHDPNLREDHMTKRRRKKRKKAQEPYRVAWRAPIAPMPPEPRPRDEQTLSELHTAIERYLDTHELTLGATDATKSVVYGHRNEPRLYLFKDEAVVRRSPRRIHADFLAPGQQWDELRALLLELQGGGEGASALPDMQETLTSLPSSLPIELRSIALQASARIRTGRTHAFMRPAVVESETIQVRFEPIHPKLLVPFTLNEEGAMPVEAALDLESPADPIAIAFHDSVDERRIIEAWIIALLAFADLSCAEDASEGSRAPSRQRGEHPPVAPPAARGRSLPRRSSKRGRSITPSLALTPIGETASYTASYIMGHRRKLNPGQHCSDDARDAARAHGIELGADWTWVQPHERGLPEDFVLRFAWQTPPQLADLTEVGRLRA
jgi:hypothetical protein